MVFFYFLSYSLITFIFFLGFQDLLNSLGDARTTYDSLSRIVEESQQALARSHDRLVSCFDRFRQVSANPGLFFQILIEADPKLVVTYDLLAYYATLFDWNSTLNFRAVVERHSSVAAWLADHQVSISVDEPTAPSGDASGSLDSDLTTQEGPIGSEGASHMVAEVDMGEPGPVEAVSVVENEAVVDTDQAGASTASPLLPAAAATPVA